MPDYQFSTVIQAYNVLIWQFILLLLQWFILITFVYITGSFEGVKPVLSESFLLLLYN